MSLPHLLSQTESENERHYGSSVQAEIDGCSISWYSDRRHTPPLQYTGLMYQNQAWAEYEYINERERLDCSTDNTQTNNNLGHIIVIWQMLCLNVIFV